MIVIGITGRSGSGKGYVCEIFSRKGIPSIDTDAVTRIVYEPGQACYQELVREFGGEILKSDGEIDRAALFKKAFSDKESYSALNSIAHRHVLDYCRKWLKEKSDAGFDAAIVDAPLLFESGFDRECDVTVAVVSDDKTRRKRLLKRDSVTESDIEKRLSKQRVDSFYLEKCTYIVYNMEGQNDLDEQVDKIINCIKNI